MVSQRTPSFLDHTKLYGSSIGTAVSRVVGSAPYPALLPDHSTHYTSATLFYLCLRRTPGSFQPRGLGPCHPMASKTLVSKLLVSGSVQSQRAHLLREAFPGHCISSTVTSFTVFFTIFPEKVPFSHLFVLFNVSFSNWSVSLTKQDYFPLLFTHDSPVCRTMFTMCRC